MRVLHLTDRLSARGGADWHLLGVMAEQVRRGHEVIVAVGRRDPGVVTPAQVVEVPVLADGRRLAPVSMALPQADVVHVHNAIGPAVLRWVATKNGLATVQDHRSFCPGRGKLTAAGEVCRVAMSADACADCFDDPGYRDAIVALTGERRDALRGMAAVVVLSRYMQAELADVGIDATVIPPFVHGLRHTGEAPADRQRDCVLFAGRLVDAKGVRDAIAAWREADVDLPLVIAGTGSLRRAPDFAALTAGVEVLGWVPHERFGALLARAHALLLPSRWQEPFGIVGLEALWAGVPVVAWESGGVAEWHPGTPPLAPWGDVSALARTLREVVLGETARARPSLVPRGFETDDLMAELDAVYARVVSGRTAAQDRETTSSR